MTIGEPGSRADATRTQILDTALAAFAENGYRAASIRDIASRCGISHPTLLYHFPSKPDLLMAVLNRRDETDPQGEGFHSLAPRQMLAQLVTIARMNATRRGIVELFAQLSAEASDPDHPAHHYFMDRYATLREALARAYRELADEGAVREGLDPALAASQVVAVMDGLQIQWLLDDASVDMAKALEGVILATLAPNQDLAST